MRAGYARKVSKSLQYRAFFALANVKKIALASH